MTYAEKIRNMTDEELSIFIESINTIDDIGRTFTYIGTEFETIEKGNVFRWLKSTVN